MNQEKQIENICTWCRNCTMTQRNWIAAIFVDKYKCENCGYSTDDLNAPIFENKGVKKLSLE